MSTKDSLTSFSDSPFRLTTDNIGIVGDGRVERQALIFSCKNFKIATHC